MKEIIIKESKNSLEVKKIQAENFKEDQKKLKYPITILQKNYGAWITTHLNLNFGYVFEVRAIPHPTDNKRIIINGVVKKS